MPSVDTVTYEQWLGLNKPSLNHLFIDDINSVDNLSHSESCFEWDRCDICYDDKINSQISEIEPVISESYGRTTIQNDKYYAGYSPADRKHQMLDMTDNLSDVTDAWIIYRREIQCSRCNLMYHSAISQCPNC